MFNCKVSELVDIDVYILVSMMSADLANTDVLYIAKHIILLYMYINDSSLALYYSNYY